MSLSEKKIAKKQRIERKEITFSKNIKSMSNKCKIVGRIGKKTFEFKKLY